MQVNPTSAPVYVVSRVADGTTPARELLAAFTQQARAIGYAKYREETNDVDNTYIEVSVINLYTYPE